MPYLHKFTRFFGKDPMSVRPPKIISSPEKTEYMAIMARPALKPAHSIVLTSPHVLASKDLHGLGDASRRKRPKPRS